jgi:hypothetical protein
MSKIDMPKVDMPKVDMPKVDMPKVDMPKVDMPKVDMPKVDMPKVDIPKVDMAKQTVVAIATMLVASGAIIECRAASGLRLTCSGNLTNTREDGITLGQCDLNFLPVKDIDSIEDICGIPGTIDTPAENKCRIRATVSPQASRAADHRELYRVLEVITVDKR